MSGENEAPNIGKLIYSWVHRKFGIPGLVVLWLAAPVGGGIVWVLTHWSDVKSWPGFSIIDEQLCRASLPKADEHRFSVAVAHLDDDQNEGHERLILRLLRDFEGIQVLSFDCDISSSAGIPEEGEREGHQKARSYLAASGATVLIWGNVLSLGNQTIPDLYLTVARGELARSRQYRLESETEFRLPKVFWDDLSDVLGLVVSARFEAFSAEEGRYVADRLGSFIARVKNLLKAGTNRPGWNPEALILTRVILANALMIYGRQVGESERLHEAVAIYRAVLKEQTRERAPLDWAKTQNNLGIALAELGELENVTARLNEAVAAFRAALEVRTRERLPLDWAAMQNNLGVVLRSLGERESATALLEDAVTEFRAALGEYTRERVPLRWATTQNNLGGALWALGDRKREAVLLEKAVVAFRVALEELTRERVPLDWAATQNNLGAALQSLGDLKRDRAALEEAVAAFRAALQERTREHVPLDWAATQNNLGAALDSLGELKNDRALLEEAVAAFRAAQEEYTRERAPREWSKTQNNLGNALAALGERESGTARLEEAVTAFRAALEERSHEPLLRAMTLHNVGNAFAIWGQRENGTAQLEEAVKAYSAALIIFEREGASQYVSATKKSLANVVNILMTRRGL